MVVSAAQLRRRCIHMHLHQHSCAAELPALFRAIRIPHELLWPQDLVGFYCKALCGFTESLWIPSTMGLSRLKSYEQVDPDSHSQHHSYMLQTAKIAHLPSIRIIEIFGNTLGKRSTIMIALCRNYISLLVYFGITQHIHTVIIQKIRFHKCVISTYMCYQKLISVWGRPFGRIYNPEKNTTVCWDNQVWSPVILMAMCIICAAINNSPYELHFRRAGEWTVVIMCLSGAFCEWWVHGGWPWCHMRTLCYQRGCLL